MISEAVVGGRRNRLAVVKCRAQPKCSLVLQDVQLGTTLSSRNKSGRGKGIASRGNSATPPFVHDVAHIDPLAPHQIRSDTSYVIHSPIYENWCEPPKRHINYTEGREHKLKEKHSEDPFIYERD